VLAVHYLLVKADRPARWYRDAGSASPDRKMMQYLGKRGPPEVAVQFRDIGNVPTDQEMARVKVECSPPEIEAMIAEATHDFAVFSFKFFQFPFCHH
jgi:hypothetical protein